MKATELIEQLQEYVDKNGDVDVRHYCRWLSLSVDDICESFSPFTKRRLILLKPKITKLTT